MDDRSVVCDEANGDCGPVTAATGDPWWFVGDVTVPPLHQGQEADAELTPLRGEVILEALGALAVAHAFEDAFGNEAAESIGEDVAGDAKAPKQLVEAVVPEHDVTNDEQRPPVADDLERASDGADLAPVVALQHGAQASRITCVKQVTTVQLLA